MPNFVYLCDRPLPNPILRCAPLFWKGGATGSKRRPRFPIVGLRYVATGKRRNRR